MTHRPAEGPDDESLVAAVAERDPDALRALYDRHSPWILLRLSRRCAVPDVVDEALQETFLAVWKKPGDYAGRGAVAAWIWGIAIRRLVDVLRRQPRVNVLVGRPRVEASAEERVLLSVEFGDLATALNRLSPELRAVVQLTALDGLTTREAARLLGIPTGTVKTRMMRARAQLREALA